MKNKLVEIGEEIILSEPVKVEKELKNGGVCLSVSLSRKGILVIFSDDDGKFV